MLWSHAGDTPMLAVAVGAESDASDRVAPGLPIRVWIEGPDGAIARGFIEALSQDHALIHLIDGLDCEAGVEVSVRLSFDPESPTLGLLARVVSSSSPDAGGECELEWEPGNGRAQLASRLGVTH